ncbi:hypothetical protein B0H13DRAFT_2351078 [Mycena leptocephala]|nr:hypothetical protein B0H13DRAFT_2351078 [Mycena leptocephala]
MRRRAQSPPSAQRDDLVHVDRAIAREQHRRLRRTSTNMCLCFSLATTTIARILSLAASSDDPIPMLPGHDPHASPPLFNERDESLAPHAALLFSIACYAPVPRRTRLQPGTSAVSPPSLVSPSQHSAVCHAPTLPSLPPVRAPTSSHHGCGTHFPARALVPLLPLPAIFTPLLPCPWATRLAHVIVLPICEPAPLCRLRATRLTPH